MRLNFIILQMDDAATAAAWQAGINSINQSVGTIAQGSINYKTRQWNDAKLLQQRGWALEDWNNQNAYNSPTAQMERLKAAGLNPNLVYGKGADVISQSMPRPTEAKQWNPQPVSQGRPDEGLMTYFQVQSQQATLDNLKAQNTVLANDALLKRAQTIATMQGAEGGKFDLGLKMENRDSLNQMFDLKREQLQYENVATWLKNDYYSKTQDLNLEETVTKIALMKAQTSAVGANRDEIEQRIENMKKSGKLMDFEIQLNKEGVTKNDAIYWKVIAKVLDGLGLNLDK